MRNYKAKDVDEYIAGSDEAARPILNELRNLITSAVPNVEEKISWGVPFYRYKGPLGGYSVYKNHVSFGCGGSDLQHKDRDTLEKKGYKTGKKTIQIKFNQKVPAMTIRRLLKAEVKKKEVKRAVT